MKKTIFLTGLVLLLAGCTMPMPGTIGASSSSSLPGMPPTVENAETDTGVLVESEDTSSPQTESVTASGALMESGTGGALRIGTAQKTLTVYTNAACAYCGEFLTQNYPSLAEEFVAKGKLSVEFVIVPFKKYPNSGLEAAALFCAGQEKKGLTMLQSLQALAAHDRKAVLAAGTALKLSPAFAKCLDTEEAKAAIKTGESLGITLVPSFHLNGKTVTGLPSEADMRGWIGESL